MSERISISKSTTQKLLLLYLIDCFDSGIFGNFKFQKTLYYSLKDSELKPFPYRRTHDGQFSQEAWDTLDELYEMGFIEDKRNDPTRRIWIIAEGTDMKEYAEIFTNLFADLAEKTRRNVQKYQRKGWKELGKIAHSDPDLLNTKMDELIFDGNLPDRIDVDMDPDDRFDLEMSLNPSFISAMQMLVNGVDSGEIPLEQWQVES